MTNKEEDGVAQGVDGVATRTVVAGTMALGSATLAAGVLGTAAVPADTPVENDCAARGSPAESKAVAATPNAIAEESNTAPPVCANCGACVNGHYCSRCGQRVAHSVHSIWHFAREVTEDLTHADSRLWRTLVALLFKPGFLTREFLAGRRVSYLPPLRLYLVLSVAFFLIAALVAPTSTTRFVVMPHSGAASTSASQLAHEAAAAAAGLRQANAQDCARWRYTGPWQSRVESALRATCVRALEDNGRALGESFFHNLPRALFLTVPALALLMKILYWRPRRYYIEHLLFVLHDHAFLFALLGSYSLVAAVLRPVHVSVEPLEWAIACYIPFYYYLAMRRVYGQSPTRTLGKLAVLGLGYLVTAVLVLLATALYTVLAQ